MSAPQNPFGLNLQRLRLERGLRRHEVAYELGVMTDTVGKWERGEQEPIWPHRIALAELFHVDVADFYNQGVA